MTADGPISRHVARWMMRLEAAGGVIRLVSLGITAVSTTLVAMKTFGYGWLAKPMVVTVILTGFGFAYYYTESGVYNQKNRDKQDAGINFADPGMRIQAEMWACAKLAAEKGGPLTDEEREAVKQEADQVYEAYRDGYDT
ncbi:MAG: hypothetical protein HQRvContig01_3 [Haloquadratum phage sp.]|nr:MAG: hypothetical protein HQRvContig01_3 [Haloquadratum phage sp.]